MDEPMDSFDSGQSRNSISFDAAQHNNHQTQDPGPRNFHSTNTVNGFQNKDNAVAEVNDVSKPHSDNHFTPLLRPGSMVMMTLTEEDYKAHYWPILRAAIDQLLNMRPAEYSPISYEQMYSCVYKCVCKQFSERLYNDLLSHLSSHMEDLNLELRRCENDSIPFIEKFSFLMHQYMQALLGIVPIFNYMNRFYVEYKLKSDLNEELRKLFRAKVVDTHIKRLLHCLNEASAIPFAISPPTMASIIKNLYGLNKDYSRLSPGLFAKYLPNILPPTDPAMLEQYAEEARRVQQCIASRGDIRSQGCNKRSFEDDISVN